MIDQEKVIRIIDELISEAQKVPTWKAENALRCLKKELLKEQPEIVRCKGCKHRGDSEKCILAAISKEKDFPLFILDNRGYWFCADGVKKDA